MIQDYIGFTYNGKHSIRDLKIYRTSSGRYDDNITATMTDKTVDIPGGDGQYYFGTTFKNRTFTVAYAFDNLTESDIRTIKQTFSGDGIHELVFDERPYMAWSAKVTGTASMKHLCFEENGERIYKGEGSITFTCYYPFARTPKKLWTVKENGEYILEEKDGRFAENYEQLIYTNLNEWADKDVIWTNTKQQYQEGYTGFLLCGDRPAPVKVVISPDMLDASGYVKIKKLFYLNENQTLLSFFDSFPSLNMEEDWKVIWDSAQGLVTYKNGTKTQIIPYSGNGVWKIKPGEDCSPSNFGITYDLVDSSGSQFLFKEGVLDNTDANGYIMINQYYYEEIDSLGDEKQDESETSLSFQKAGYVRNKDGILVPALYVGMDQKDKIMIEDFYCYIGNEEIDGTTYDKWQKIEPSDKGGEYKDDTIYYTWDSDAKKFIYTDLIVEQSTSLIATNIDVQFDFIYN